MNKGDRALLHGEEFQRSLSTDDIAEINKYQKIKNVLVSMLNIGGTVNTLCYCNSGRKYKNCHRQTHINDFKRIK